MFGAAVTTSSGAVGSRCPYARAKIGSLRKQHRTDPRLGPRGLDLLEAGHSADVVIAELTQNDPTIGWRQLAVIDNDGQTAFFHGDRIKSIHAESQGKDCCAIGNIIRNEDVPKAMTDAFEADPNEPLAERLLRALEAGDAQQAVEFRQIKSGRPPGSPSGELSLRRPTRGLGSRPSSPAALSAGELDKPLLERYIERVLDPDSVPYPEV